MTQRSTARTAVQKYHVVRGNLGVSSVREHCASVREYRVQYWVDTREVSRTVYAMTQDDVIRKVHLYHVGEGKVSPITFLL